MTNDIQSNRSSRKWSRKELVQRACWDAIQPVFAFSPRQAWAARRMILRAFGCQIGQQVHIYPSVKIFAPWNLRIGSWTAVGQSAILYNLGYMSLGERVTVSQNAHLCGGTHDYRRPSMDLIKSPIDVGDDAWICADAFVGPGRTIGIGAIIGARAVVTKDVDPWTIVAGNPARKIGSRSFTPDSNN